MAIIIPANTLSAAAYSIDNSCRFNGGDSARLTSDFSGTGSSSAAIATYSMWVKLALSDNRATLISGMDDTSNYLKVRFADDGAGWYFAIYGESPACDLRSTAVFRDPAAWYHVVMAFDTAQAVATNRIKVWINGSQITLWSTATYLAQNDELFLTKSNDLEIGSHNNTEFMDGYIAELVCIDGTVYTASDFGEYDSDSPTIWKPKDVSGLTFGTKGYWLNWGDSAALGDDVSGNNNDFTEVNLAATDQTTDTPTNNFCTLNPITKGSYITLSEGNLLSTGNSTSDQGSVYGTLSANKGKWYAEAKVTVGGTDSYPLVCASHINDQQYGSCTNGGNHDPGRYNTASGCYRANGDMRSNNSTSSSWGNTFDDDDIIGIAIDCDNGATYVAKNGTWENSGDPTSGASKTNAMLTWTPASEDMSTFSDSQYNSSSNNWNFGNPAFSLSSAVADADGYGQFEYAPPSGYFALCTKNLAEYG